MVDRLIAVYRAELVAYGRVLDLSREAARRAREGRPLAELHELNLAKRDILRQVETLETSIAAQKQAWREGQRLGGATHELDRLLGELRERIEEILDCERECDRWILEGSGVQDLEAVAS